MLPGGTVSGPVLMMVADVALYVAVLGEIGIVPLAVTTNLTINFLRKPSAQASIVGECKLVKIGKTIKKFLSLLCTDAKIFTGFLRFAFGERFFRLGNAPLLGKHTVLPFAALRFQELHLYAAMRLSTAVSGFWKLRCRSRDDCAATIGSSEP